MEYKTIWSSTGTADGLLNLTEDEKRDFLVEIGFDSDMLDGADLDEIIKSDVVSELEDVDYFYNEVRPMLEKDTNYGILLGAELDGDRVVAFRADDILPENPELDRVELLEDENGEVVISSNDGKFKLFIVPEEASGKQVDFVKNVMPDFEETVTYDFNATPLESYVDDYLSDTDELANWVNHDGLVEYGTPVRNTLTVQEELTEAKAKNPTDLDIELADIEADLQDFGPEGLYAVSFDRFNRQYPEFTTSVIKTFLKEMQILTKEELEDAGLLNGHWREGELILDDDWPCLLEGAHKLADGEPVQWEKIYKKYYRPSDLN